MLVQAVSAGSIFTGYGVVVAPLKMEFEPSNFVLMLGVSVTSMLSGLMSPFLGAAIDRFSVRKLMLLGVALVASGFLLMSLCQSFTQIVLIYAVFMAAASVLLGPIATSALLARWFDTKRGLAMGVASSGAAIGGLFIPPLLQGLVDGLEWRAALQVFSVFVVVVSAPMILYFVVDWPVGEQKEGETTPVAPSSVSLRASMSALRDSNFWLMALIMGAIFSGAMGIISNLIQVVAEKGFSASQGAILISLFSGASFAGKLFMASTADRLGQRMALALTLCGIVVGVVVLLQASSLNMFMLASLIIGLFSGTATPLWSLILSHIYGAARIGKMMGLMNLIFLPLTLSAPPLFGWISDVTGSYDMALLGYIGFLFVALLLVMKLRTEGVHSN